MSNVKQEFKLLLNLSFHQRFKSYAFANHRSMSSYLIVYIESLVKEAKGRRRKKKTVRVVAKKNPS